MNDFEKAFNILMEYWDYLPEEEREEINNRLNRALNHYEQTTADTYNKEYLDTLKDLESLNPSNKAPIRVEKPWNMPFKELSLKKLSVPHHKIKRALNRLKTLYGYGIPENLSISKEIINERKA